MNIWLITDTHFGHEKMIEYCGRPIGFENLILNNLLEKNKSNDIIIHLGDFCIGEDAYWHSNFMNCFDSSNKKWLIKGNHDHKSNSWYLDHGWDWVGTKFQDKYFGKNIMFSHQPTKQNGSFDLNIHGHFHNALHRLQEGRYISDQERLRNVEDLKALTPQHKLLAIEYTDYKPVLLEEFIK